MLTGDALLAKVKELTIMEPTEPVSREQLIRVKILPQLESVSDYLIGCHDNGPAKYFGRKLDKITEELITILNQEDT